MFVFGLVVGPLLGLLLGDALSRTKVVAPRIGILGFIVVLAVVLFAGFLNEELRISLAGGVLLGLLLAMTPAGITRDRAV